MLPSRASSPSNSVPSAASAMPMESSPSREPPSLAVRMYFLPPTVTPAIWSGMWTPYAGVLLAPQPDLSSYLLSLSEASIVMGR